MNIRLGRGRERRPAGLFLLPAVVIILLTTLYPLAYSLFLSGQSWNMAIPNSQPVANFPDNYTALLTDQTFLSSVRTTFVFVGVSVVLELAIGMALALLITSTLRFLGFVRTMLLIPVMIAPVVVGVLWRTLYHTDYGPVNDLLATLGLPGREWLGDASNALSSVILVEVWQQTPVVTLILAAGIASIPVELGEAAKVDGASGPRTFWSVTLPLLRRVILVVLVLRIMDLFKTFDLIFTLTQGGPGGATDVLSNLIYRTGLRAFQIGTSAAMSWVFLVIVVLVSLVFVRQVMRREDSSS
ncbi:MAG: carbohydrate ABC transporter permease [Chloroflexota bacterium]